MTKTIEEIRKEHQEVIYPTVRVRTGKAGGSGLIIYSKPIPEQTIEGGEETEYETYVMTCFHVIESAVSHIIKRHPFANRDIKEEVRELVDVETFKYEKMSTIVGSTVYKAKIVAWDKELDLALLKIQATKPFKYVAKLFPRNKADKIKLGMESCACGCSLGHEPILCFGHIMGKHDMIKNHQYWLSTANTIFGNCLPKDARIYVNAGIKNIADINNGDFVYSLDSDGSLKRKQVINVINSGKQKLYGIKTNTRYLRASANHPLLTPIGWRKIEELKRGDLIAVCNGIPTNKGSRNYFGTLVNFDRIKTIDALDIEDTYDLQIDGTHNFIADGVIVHNSGGALFLDGTHEYIGMTARISGYHAGFQVDVITWMGFAIPIDTIYKFWENQLFQFIYDPNYNSKQCEILRKKKREEEEKKLMLPEEIFSSGTAPEKKESTPAEEEKEELK